MSVSWIHFSGISMSGLTKTDGGRQNRPYDSRRAQTRKHLEEHIACQAEAVLGYWADRIEGLQERALGDIGCGVRCLVGADAVFSRLLVGQNACDSELVGVVELSADCHCRSVVLGFWQAEEGEDASETGEDC